MSSSTPTLFAGGWTYETRRSPWPAAIRRAPTIWMFSPSFAASSARCSSSSVDRLLAALVHLAQHVVRERQEVLVLRDRLGLAADRDDRAVCVVGLDEDDALGRLAVGALRGGRHALLAQELDGRVEVAVRLLQRALAVHHPRARRVAELLHHGGGDLGHDFSSSASAGSGGSRPARPRRRRRRCGFGSDGAGASSAGAGVAGAAGSGAAGCSGAVTASTGAAAAAVLGSGSARRAAAGSAAAAVPPLRRAGPPRRRCGRLGAAAARGCRGGAPVARRGHLVRRDALLAGLDPVGDRAHDQRARADRVVVARDHVLGLVGIAVRVHERDHRQAEPLRLAHGELLLAQVDDEDRVGLAAHVGDAAEVRLELLELGRHRDPLLRGQQVELRLLGERAQLVQPLDAVGDRAPVREQAAEPAVVDVRHADAGRLGRDRVLRLLLRADEQDGAAALGDVRANACASSSSCWVCCRSMM